MILTITYFVRFRLIKVMPLLTLKEIADMQLHRTNACRTFELRHQRQTYVIFTK